MDTRHSIAAAILVAAALAGAGCSAPATPLALRNDGAQPLRVAYRVSGQAPQTVTVSAGAQVPVPAASAVADLQSLSWGDAHGTSTFHDLAAAAAMSSCRSHCVVTFGGNRVRFTA